MLKFNPNGTHAYDVPQMPPCPTGTSIFSTTLLALDAMLRAPISGHQRAFHVRKQLAYCQHYSVGATDLFEYSVPVRYLRDSHGHKPSRSIAGSAA